MTKKNNTNIGKLFSNTVAVDKSEEIPNYMSIERSYQGPPCGVYDSTITNASIDVVDGFKDNEKVCKIFLEVSSTKEGSTVEYISNLQIVIGDVIKGKLQTKRKGRKEQYTVNGFKTFCNIYSAVVGSKFDPNNIETVSTSVKRYDEVTKKFIESKEDKGIKNLIDGKMKTIIFSKERYKKEKVDGKWVDSNKIKIDTQILAACPITEDLSPDMADLYRTAITEAPNMNSKGYISDIEDSTPKEPKDSQTSEENKPVIEITSTGSNEVDSFENFFKADESSSKSSDDGISNVSDNVKIHNDFHIKENENAKNAEQVNEENKGDDPKLDTQEDNIFKYNSDNNG